MGGHWNKVFDVGSSFFYLAAPGQKIQSCVNEGLVFTQTVAHSFQVSVNQKSFFLGEKQTLISSSSTCERSFLGADKYSSAFQCFVFSSDWASGFLDEENISELFSEAFVLDSSCIASLEKFFEFSHSLSPMVIDCFAGAFISQAINTQRNRIPTRIRKRLETGHFPSPVRKAKNHIVDCCFDRKMRLVDLAKAAHLSPYHFLRVFSKEVGMSPGQFQQKLRAEIASERLRAGEAVTNVAHSLGYSDSASLYRSVKKFMGVAPSVLGGSIHEDDR